MIKKLKDSFLTGLKKSFKTLIFMSKIVIPVYFLIKVLEYTKLIIHISSFFAPFMKVFGLPGSSAIVILTGNLLNLYGAIAAMSAFTFTTREITIISIMLLFSHSLILETTIIKKLSIPRLYQLTLRLLSMIIVGILLNILW